MAMTYLLDTSIKGEAHFAHFGGEYLTRTPVPVALCLIAIVTTSKRYNLAFVTTLCCIRYRGSVGYSAPSSELSAAPPSYHRKKRPMLRVAQITRTEVAKGQAPAFDVVVLAHDERHVRRRAIELSQGERVLLDLPESVLLESGDLLVLEDGRTASIIAAKEELYDIRARNAVHLTQLAWHIGNRHLPAAISAEHILILRDHVIKAMLEGLGATIADIVAPFEPVRGAYSGHGHDHDHGGHHDYHHD